MYPTCHKRQLSQMVNGDPFYSIHFSSPSLSSSLLSCERNIRSEHSHATLNNTPNRELKWGAMTPERHSIKIFLKQKLSGQPCDERKSIPFESRHKARGHAGKPDEAGTSHNSLIRRTSRSAPAIRGISASSNTPITTRCAPAGLVIGPKMLNTVRIPSAFRTGATFFIAG